MSQELKNRYYDLIQSESMELVSLVFTELDHLILRHESEEKIVETIETLQAVEPRLYEVMIQDWKEGMFL